MTKCPHSSAGSPDAALSHLLFPPPTEADRLSVSLPAPAGWGSRLVLYLTLRLLLGVHLVCLRHLPLSTFVRRLRKAGGARWRPEHLAYAFRRIDAMLGCGHGQSTRRCLVRSTLLFRSLTLAGLQPELNIGLTTKDNAMGHAWVSLDQHVVLDSLEASARFPLFLCRDQSIVYWLESPGGTKHEETLHPNPDRGE